MAVNIDGDGLIALGGTSSTQGRVRLAEDSDNGTNYVELTAPASVGSDRVITFPDGTGTVSVNGVSSNIVSGTAVASTSGTSIDFTGIPAYVKRVTVMFDGVSTNGTSGILVQLGDSGGIENTGYVSGSVALLSGGAGTLITSTSGILAATAFAAANTLHGIVTVATQGTNIWSVGGSTYRAAIATYVVGGSKTLSDTLDRLRITTINGTDTFDAGSINILYE